MKTRFIVLMSERINNAGYDRKLMQILMRLTIRCERKGDVTIINEIMKRIDTDRTHYGLVSGMLRSSLRVFHYLDAWLPLQQRLIASMTRREENYRSLLIGMLDMSRYMPSTELDDLIGVHKNFRERV